MTYHTNVQSFRALQCSTFSGSANATPNSSNPLRATCISSSVVDERKSTVSFRKSANASTPACHNRSPGGTSAIAGAKGLSQTRTTRRHLSRYDTSKPRIAVRLTFRRPAILAFAHP